MDFKSYLTFPARLEFETSPWLSRYELPPTAKVWSLSLLGLHLVKKEK